MKALAAFWAALFWRLPAFVMLAGFVFVRGQSPSIKVVDLIPASLSGETNQDSEPFLAVSSCQSPDHGSLGVHSQFVFHEWKCSRFTFSEDGGNTWVLNAITPVQRMTCDITHAMPTGENHPRGDLHAGTLACAASITLDESESNDCCFQFCHETCSPRETNVESAFRASVGLLEYRPYLRRPQRFQSAQRSHGNSGRIGGWRGDL